MPRNRRSNDVELTDIPSMDAPAPAPFAPIDAGASMGRNGRRRGVSGPGGSNRQQPNTGSRRQGNPQPGGRGAQGPAARTYGDDAADLWGSGFDDDSLDPSDIAEPRHTSVWDDAGSAAPRRTGARQTSAPRPAPIVHTELEEKQPKQRRQKQKPQPRERKPKQEKGMGFLAHPIRFIKTYGRGGVWDAFLLWSNTHQIAYFVIGALFVLVGMMYNKYVSVVAALAMVGIGWASESQNDDYDSMLIYLAAVITFMAPFLY